MPIHDWTRVKAGIYHHFHQRWIGAICDGLNDGLLPGHCYALAEQLAGEIGPDVLALQARRKAELDLDEPRGALAVATAPPNVALISDADEAEQYAREQNSVVIRHATDDELIALVEIISPGNKQARQQLERFVAKALGALRQGIHLLIADLFPPGRRDPAGIHGAIWAELQSEPYEAPAGKPLTLVAYEAKVLTRAYVEPIAVGSVLTDMPLFIAPGRYVNVPLERTYMLAYASVPERWRAVIEGREGIGS